MKRFVALAAALAALVAPQVVGASETAVQTAERCWRQRARSFATKGEVDRAAIGCAIAEWRAAQAAEPLSLELSMRRIEALWFAAHFAARDAAERRAWLDEGVEVADAAVAEADRRAGVRGEALALAARAEALRSVPEAGPVHFFAAIAWGEWGLHAGWLPAAARGVPRRGHLHSELAARLSPEYRDGGGLRLLGRVLTTMPKVPLVTGWVDRQRGRELLERALAISRRDPRNLLFVAEAILEQQPERRGEAVALLRETVAREPDLAELVEQSETIAEARRALARLGGRSDG